MLNIITSTTTQPRYELVVCEYFHRDFHGFDDDSDPHIESQYLVHTRFPVPPSTSTDPWKNIHAVCLQLGRLYRNLLQSQPSTTITHHPVFRHYRHLADNPRTYSLQLAEVHHLRGGECVAVLKTFWLRLVQRSWKRVFAKRQEVLRRRGRPEELAWFQRVGKWSPECGTLPSVLGMMAVPARPALRVPAA